MVAVPRRWIRKSPTRIAHEIGTTQSPRPGAAIFAPSTAERTEMAGVNGGVAVEQCGAEHAEEDQRVPARLRSALVADEGDERQDPAFAVVVGLHDEEQVLDGDDDDQGPEHEREETEDIRLGDGQLVTVAVKRLPEGVERARPDVAVHDAERTEGEERDGPLGDVTVLFRGHPP